MSDRRPSSAYSAPGTRNEKDWPAQIAIDDVLCVVVVLRSPFSATGAPRWFGATRIDIGEAVDVVIDGQRESVAGSQGALVVSGIGLRDRQAVHDRVVRIRSGTAWEVTVPVAAPRQPDGMSRLVEYYPPRVEAAIGRPRLARRLTPIRLKRTSGILAVESGGLPSIRGRSVRKIVSTCVPKRRWALHGVGRLGVCSPVHGGDLGRPASGQTEVRRSALIRRIPVPIES